jgi:hypothetical protein
MSDSATRKPRGRPFAAGNAFGRGRPKGSLNKTTLLARELLGEHAEEITNKVIALAKQGDPAAMKMAMDRICPIRPGAPVTWKMPPLIFFDDVPAAYSSLMQAIAKGELTPAEGQQIQHILERMADVLRPSPWSSAVPDVIKTL